MARPHAKNNGNPSGSGIKAAAKKRWDNMRKQAAAPVVSQILRTVAELDEPSDVTKATSRRVTETLLRQVTETRADVLDILGIILEAEKTAAEALTGNKRIRTMQALDTITEAFWPTRVTVAT